MDKLENINYLIGGSKIDKVSIKPFDEKVCFFLNSLSNELNSIKEINQYPDF